jgi:hypothetical protein
MPSSLVHYADVETIFKRAAALDAFDLRQWPERTAG